MAHLISGQTSTVTNEQTFIRLAMLKVPQLRKLSRSVQRRLQQHLSCRMLSAGAVVRMGGGKRSDVFFIIKGTAVARKSTFDGPTTVPLKIGDLFADDVVGVNVIRPTSVKADTDCIMCSMSAQTYKQVLAYGTHAEPGTLKVMDVVVDAMKIWMRGTSSSGSRPRT